MTLVPGDKVILVPTAGGKKIALPIKSPNLPGGKCLMVPTAGGKKVAIKLATVVPGDKVILIPDSGGKKIAVKCGGIAPNPPVPAGWAQIFAESPGWYTYKAKAWGNYIYVTMTNFGIGVIWRYSDSLGWEPVIDGPYGVSIIYDLEVFGGKIYFAYAGSGGGIARSSDGSYGSFAQVYDAGGGSCVNLAANGGKLFAVCDGTRIISSPDGTTWSTVYTELDPNKSFFALASDGANLHLGQADTTPTPWQGDVLSSANGVGWASEGYPALAGEQVVGIDYVDGSLYVGTRSWIGGDMHIFKNGAAVHTAATGDGFWAFCGCEDLLLAAGSGNEVLCSTNGGSTWTSNFIAPIGGFMMSIGSLGKRVYAGSSDSLVIFQSPKIK